MGLELGGKLSDIADKASYTMCLFRLGPNAVWCPSCPIYTGWVFLSLHGKHSQRIGLVYIV